MQRILAFSCGAEFQHNSQSEKVYFFPNPMIFFPIAHYKKEMATDILFHPFIPIHQRNSPLTPYILWEKV